MKRGDILANLDWLSVFLFIALVFMGWINIYSAVYDPSHPSILDLDHRYGKQFVWICAAFIIAILILFIDSRFYEFFAYGFYIFMIILLLMVLVIGKEVNSSKSWFALGGLQIQPSEFAKPAVAIALAKFLSIFNLNIKKTSNILKAGAIILLPFSLILLQPDAGSAMVYFAFILVLYREGFSWIMLLIALALVLLFFLVLILPEFTMLTVIISLGAAAYFFASRNFKQTLIGIGIYLALFGLVFGVSEISGLKYSLYVCGLLSLFLSLTTFAILVMNYRIRRGFYVLAGICLAVAYSFTVDYAFDNVLSEYQQHRVNIMLGIKSDPLGAGYNVNQSKIAIGSGGFLGKGFLNGTQTKLNFVPEQSTDFIFCTVGEEWGYVGSIIVIGIFTLLLLRLIVVAERQRSVFARVYGYGVFSIILLHFLVNISMTIGLFPVIGIPLPFFSYGGSSLWAFTILLFIFLRLDASRKEYLI
jgi:rod shape determining protein RodA